MHLARRLLPLLMLLSGFCGISYEILYTKLLGNLLGNQFIINATVLLTFLLGIGLGTLYAHRLVRFLWTIEAGIGLYAAALTSAHGAIDRLLYTRLPELGTNVAAGALACFVLLLVPAFLIGCSVPLFAAYFASTRPTQAFSVTYGLYNVGAALTALAMEFALLRAVGLHAATLLLASLNGVVALGVWMLVRRHPLVLERPVGSLRFPRRVLAALATASVGSAIFQLLMIKLAEFVIGPYNETFSLVLATVLLGLAVGSAAVVRAGLSFAGALLLALAGVAWVLAALPGVIELYAWLYPSAARSYPLLVLLKFAFVLLLMGMPAVGFGATVPALLRTHRDVARESGQLLFCASLANAFGFLLMAFVLHRQLDYGPILLVVAATCVAALWWTADGLRWARWAALAGLALAAVLRGAFWQEQLLYVGHTSFHSLAQLQHERRERTYADRFKGAQDVFAITWRDGEPYFFINGYISIPLRSSAEKLVGALSSMLAPRTDEALVLGVGSGATASVVGLVFDHTDGVEINEVVLENLHRMSEYNFDIERTGRVNLVHDDGIHFIKTSSRRYSLILNTVTTPLYFSSSKLYTRDFFELVRARLKPDGVYVTWLDNRIGDRGADIILETLAGSFERCWLGYVRSAYYLLACSPGELSLRSFEAVSRQPALHRDFARRFQLPLRALPYSLLSTDALALRSGNDLPVNTLDFPVLEFEMARLQSRSGLEGLKQRLMAQSRWQQLQAQLGRWMRWDRAEFLFFADLRDSIEFGTGLRRQIGGDAYDEAAFRLAREIGSADALARFGEVLRRQQRQRAAAEAFGRALAIDPWRDGANYGAGLSLAAAEDWEGALGHFLREWERDRSPRAALGASRALLHLARFDEARAWLETARSLEPGAPTLLPAEARPASR